MSFAEWELLNEPTSKQEDWACSLDDGDKKTGFIPPALFNTILQLLTIFVVFCCSCLPSEAWTLGTTKTMSSTCHDIWVTCFDGSPEVHVQDGTASELRAPHAWSPVMTAVTFHNDKITKAHLCVDGSIDGISNGINTVPRAPQGWSCQADNTLLHDVGGVARHHLDGTGNHVAAQAHCESKGDNVTNDFTYGRLVSALGAGSARDDRALVRELLGGGVCNFTDAAKCKREFGGGRLTTPSGNTFFDNTDAGRRASHSWSPAMTTVTFENNKITKAHSCVNGSINEVNAGTHSVPRAPQGWSCQADGTPLHDVGGVARHHLDGTSNHDAAQTKCESTGGNVTNGFIYGRLESALGAGSARDDRALVRQHLGGACNFTAAAKGKWEFGGGRRLTTPSGNTFFDNTDAGRSCSADLIT